MKRDITDNPAKIRRYVWDHTPELYPSKLPVQKRTDEEKARAEAAVNRVLDLIEKEFGPK